MRSASKYRPRCSRSPTTGDDLALGLHHFDGHHVSASFALVRWTITDSEPSGRRRRYMPGHLSSGTMRGSSVREAGFEAREMGVVSVTRVAGAGSALGGAPVTLRTAPAGGRPALNVPLTRHRALATRHLSPQYRAVDHWGLNATPHWAQLVTSADLWSRCRPACATSSTD
jgi:hypothetical protein